ncbi:MAG: hypothetical protein K8S94_10565, partial [Planctomycetia bacterium]|nr:hypothetical protein [Planctomycetia bacterium]
MIDTSTGRVVGFLGQVIQRNFYGTGGDEIHAVEQITWGGTTPTTSSYWTFTDHQDSVRDIVSGNAADRGAVVEHRQYDSFGKIVRRTSGPQAWYEPATGRFINEDPSGLRGGDANLFRYVGNDPLDKVDPSGLAAKWASYAGGISTSATLPKAASPSVSAMAFASLQGQQTQAAPAVSIPAATLTVSTIGGSVYAPGASRPSVAVPPPPSAFQRVYFTEVEPVTTPPAGSGVANAGWRRDAAYYGAATRDARAWTDAAGNRWNTDAGEISAYGPPPLPPTWGQFAEAVSGLAVAVA